jgi:hypothetical protein
MQWGSVGFHVKFITVYSSSIYVDQPYCKPLSTGFCFQLMEQWPTSRAEVALDITLSSMTSGKRSAMKNVAACAHSTRASRTFYLQRVAQRRSRLAAWSSATATMAGVQPGVKQNAVMSPFPFQHSLCQLRSVARASLALASTASDNRLLGSDTQPQVAASRRGLRAGQRQR